jgi:type IV fimbrial biogenesis protein FimT
VARMPGFTLAELLVALAVAAILVTLAAPAFAGYLRDLQQAAALNALAHAVHTARAMGASAGQPVGLCGSSDGRDCSGSGDWSAGLLLRSLRTGPAPDSRYTSLGRRTGRLSVRANRAVIEFRPLDRFATPATITVCDDRGSAAARALIISRTGRLRVSNRDPSGRLLSCP